MSPHPDTSHPTPAQQDRALGPCHTWGRWQLPPGGQGRGDGVDLSTLIAGAFLSHAPASPSLHPSPSREVRRDQPRAATKGSAVGGAAQRGLRFQMNIDSANYRPPCRQLISLSQKDGIELGARGIHGAQQDAPQTAQRSRQANNLQQN